MKVKICKLYTNEDASNMFYTRYYSKYEVAIERIVVPAGYNGVQMRFNIPFDSTIVRNHFKPIRQIKL